MLEYKSLNNTLVAARSTPPISVLHILSGVIFGGVERTHVTLGRYRSTCRELDQEFAYCFSGKLEEELNQTGATLHCLGPTRLSRPWTIFRARHNLRDTLRKKTYDVVVCNSPWAMLIFAESIRQMGPKLVFVQHDYPKGSNGAYSMGGILEHLARRIIPDLVVCNSHFTSQFVGQLYPGVDSEVWICPADLSPIDRSQRNEKRSEMAIYEPNTAVILQVSRMESWKGHRLHLQALGRLKDLKTWQCWMVGGPQTRGENEYMLELISLAEQLGIKDRVNFLGWRDDVRELMTAADIFCQPNTSPEPFGSVYIEALHAGLPVVATAFGGAQEIITPDCGLLTNPDDPADVEAALRALVTDPSLRIQFAEHAVQRARYLCDPEERVRALYEMLLRKLHSQTIVA